MTADTRLAGLQDIPSDVKTVAYYCVSAESAGSGGVMNRRTGRYESGLVRRVMDRAVTLYATENGNLQGLQQAAEVIAPKWRASSFNTSMAANGCTSGIRASSRGCRSR